MLLQCNDAMLPVSSGPGYFLGTEVTCQHLSRFPRRSFELQESQEAERDPAGLVRVVRDAATATAAARRLEREQPNRK